MRGEQFLTAILGPQGLQGFSEAVARSPGLAGLVAPRAIMSWLSAVGDRFDGQIPGIDTAMLKFERTGGLYAGEFRLGQTSLLFDAVPGLEVVAMVAVATGADEGLGASVKDTELARLGKSLDKLVATAWAGKSDAARVAQFIAEQDVGPLNKFEKPGITAKPAAAQAPAAPTGPAPPTNQAKQPKATPHQGHIPGVTKPMTKTLKISKHEASAGCCDCGGETFKNDRFVGCPCTRDLAKSIDTRVVEGGYLLKFSTGVSALDFTTLAQSLRRGA